MRVDWYGASEGEGGWDVAWRGLVKLSMFNYGPTV